MSPVCDFLRPMLKIARQHLDDLSPELLCVHTYTRVMTVMKFHSMVDKISNQLSLHLHQDHKGLFVFVHSDYIG